MEVHVKRPVLCVVLVVLGLATLTWAGLPDGASPSSPNAAAAASPEPAPTPNPTPAIGNSPSMVDSLLSLMVSKGVITGAEANSLRTLPPGQQLSPLLSLLAQKGVLTQADLAALNSHSAGANAAVVTSGGASFAVASPVSYGYGEPAVVSGSSPASQPPPPSGPAVIPAIAPIRVLPVDPPRREGMIPDIHVGPVGVKPYGFFKMSTVYDSSQPRGDDFPLPGFIYGDTGPNASPEFHVKARSSRFGSNFEWLDPSKKLTVTAKIEFDFEGNFSAADNRNISSMRSNMPSLRLAYGRLDYAASDNTTIYGVFGQDWTPFGSSTLPNTLETTGVGIGFGSLYERDPQVRGGFVHKFETSRNLKLLAEAAAVMPSFGNVPSSSAFQIPGVVAGNNVVNVFAPGTTTVIGTVTIPQTANTGLGLADQLAYGERQGADSARPEVQGRVALQWQLDKAPGVAPAQIIVSGEQGERTAIVPKGNVPKPVAGGALPTTFWTAAYPTGVQVSSNTWGGSYEIQLPTRWLTLIASFYNGADLRYYFAGQLYSYYNNSAAMGLKNTAGAPSIDGSATVIFGNLNGAPAVATQRPVRAYGGFAELGLPLSRWFNANPKGRMAGWTANVHYGEDQANAADERKLNPAGQRYKSDWFFGNVQYKLNSWVTLGYEESAYRTFSLPNAEGAYTTLFQGVPAHEWKDIRSEFATIFSF